MAKGFNKVTLLGNLTRDPETRATTSGQSVTSFSLAVNRTWKGSDGSSQEEVSYFDCTAWGKAGEIIAQYTQKGRALLVSGRLRQSTWEQEGQKRSKVEVVVEDFNFISDGSGGGSSRPTSQDSAPAPAKEDTKTDTAKGDDKKAKDTKTDDSDDQPIDLSDIPF